MRIQIAAADTISPQASTCAEHRLFAVLSQIVDTGRVCHARVVRVASLRGSAELRRIA